MNVEQLIRLVAGRFESAGLEYGHGTDNALDEAAWLVFAELCLRHEDAPAAYAGEVPAERLEAIETLARRRIVERVPLAYLLNEAWFCGLRFYVDCLLYTSPSPRDS